MDLFSVDLVSQRIERSELKQGDHIYSWRKQGYTHHGIYIGEGKIIHFGNPKRQARGGGGGGGGLLASLRGFSTSGGAGEKTCSNSFCKLEKVAESGVRMSCVDCFTKRWPLCRYKYQVSREFLLAKTIAGTCTTAESDPPEEVIYRATYLYENGYLKYDQLNNNCEEFALYCKTGLWSNDIGYQGRSSQANVFHPTSQPNKHRDFGEKIYRIATAIPKTFSKREGKDLGVRKDVMKVPVEELLSFCASLK